jgi:hypothetical protein
MGKYLGGGAPACSVLTMPAPRTLPKKKLSSDLIINEKNNTMV